MQKKPNKQEKSYYLVEIEGLVPVTLKYRVLAENSEEAINEHKNSPLLENPNIKMSKIKKVHAKVYEMTTSQLKLIKNL